MQFGLLLAFLVTVSICVILMVQPATLLEPIHVRLASTEEVTLLQVYTLDGVSMVKGDRILLKDQNEVSENGLYRFNGKQVKKIANVGLDDMVLVSEGATNAQLIFVNRDSQITPLGQISTEEPICSEDGQTNCLTNDRFRAGVLKGDFSGPPGIPSFSIPSGYYDGSTTGLANDPELSGVNVCDDVTIFDTAGSRSCIREYTQTAAEPDNVFPNKEIWNADGNLFTGTMTVINTFDVTQAWPGQGYYGPSQTLISTAASFAANITVFGVTGTAPFPVDATLGADADVGDMLATKEGWNAAGLKITGTMPNRGTYNARLAWAGSGSYNSTITGTPEAILYGIDKRYFGSNGTRVTWRLFASTGSLSVPRIQHATVVLRTGKILLVGGSDGSSALATCVLYDATAGTFSSTGSMSSARDWPTATALPNGKILVIGSESTLADLYDPIAGTFATTGAMSIVQHTATLVPRINKVLVAGGFKTGSAQTACSLYDVVANSFSSTGSLSAARYQHTAVLLGNGNVFIAGGTNGSSTLASCEIYDPIAGTFSSTGSMITARKYHSALLLYNGKVLLIGGNDGSATLSSAEIYDPDTGTCTATGSMATARQYHTATQIPGGTIIVIGGTNGGSLSSCESYNVVTGVFSTSPSLITARYGHTATLLPTNAKVLVAGGSTACELFT